MLKYLRWLSLFSALGAVWSALGRAKRSGQHWRAAWSAMLGGAAVASFSLLLSPDPVLTPWWLAWFVIWCGGTHAAMALAESFLAWWVIGRAKLHPGRALRGAIIASMLGHIGGFLAVVLFLLGNLLGTADETGVFFLSVWLLPFSVVGGLLASVGTIYGDLSRAAPRQTDGEHVPG